MNGYRSRSLSPGSRHRRFWLFVGATLSASGMSAAQGETWVPYLQTWAGLAGSHMGASIAVDGDASGAKFVYVGAPYETVDGQAEAGAVYVWAPSGPGVAPVTRLFMQQPQAGAHFGASVAARNGDLMIGIPGYSEPLNPSVGGAVFFYHNYGTSIAIKGSRTGLGGGFGGAVALNQGFAATAAVDAGNGDGCIYTYKYLLGSDSWTPFPVTDDHVCGSGGEKLGASLAIRWTGTDTFLLVAGAPAATQNNNALAGAAHVYAPNNGVLLEISMLAAQSPAFLDAFGTSVGVDANFIYVGGTGRDNGAGRTGSVTIFEPAPIFGFNYLGEYFPGAPATIGGHCGASLNVDPVPPGGFILGCPDSDTVYFNGEGTARVYRPFVFLGTPVWLESLLTYGSIYHGADALGTSVDIYGNLAVAGAPKAQAQNGAFKEFVRDKVFQNGFNG